MNRLSALLVAAVLTASVPSHAQAPLPAGHPSTGAASAAPALEEDAVVISPSVPPGSIQVRLVKADGTPLPHTDLTLNVQFNKVAEGEKKTEQRAKTDDLGVATFSGLTTGGDFSYRVVTHAGPAQYASDPIQLKADAGVSVLLHVYPVTRNVQEAPVGAIVFVYVETRDDVFQFEVLARYGNRGAVSWVPDDDARMELPSGFKAFKAGEAMTDVRFEEEPGRGARLRGTFSPGQQQASMRFQVARHGESSASFRIGLPPHVGEVRFIAEAAPSMEIDVDGFEKPQIDVSQTGQRVLVTRRVAGRGSTGLTAFTAQLSGIPTPGWGRWVAALIAAGLATLGFAAFGGKVGSETQAELQQRDAARAKRVLLDEVVDLTRARKQQRVGPSTYESARRALVEALSRVVSQNPGLSRKSRRGAGKKPKKASA